MSQITIRDLDSEIESFIRLKSKADHKSLSDTAKELLRQAVGLEKGSGKKRNLRPLAGSWSIEDLATFEKTQGDFGLIDKEIPPTICG